MKIFIVSKGHLPRMHLFDWFVREAAKLGHKITVVTHYRTMANDIRTLTHGAGVKVVTTGSDYLRDSRQMIIDELTRKGDWFIGMDDNIQRFNMLSANIDNGVQHVDTSLPAPRPFGTWRNAYRIEMTPAQVMRACDALMDKCEANGTIYGGFASMENPFFRMRKWSEVRFVKSKAFVMLNDGHVEWDGPRCGQDSAMSCAVVARYGCVAVNNWIHPVHKMYEAGGIGKGDERRVWLNPQLERIIELFPGLVKMGKGANTALRFLRTSKTAVTKWRQEQDGGPCEFSTPPKGRR